MGTVRKLTTKHASGDTAERLATLADLAIYGGTKLRRELAMASEPLSANQAGQVAASIAGMLGGLWIPDYGEERAYELANSFMTVFLHSYQGRYLDRYARLEAMARPAQRGRVPN